MGKKKQKVLYDADGARRVMRKRDYMADMGGQLAIGVMANLVGQLTYFYTDKVGMAVGGVGIAMMIAKIIDALTDVLVGNMIDHSKGGNKKYYSWMLKMAIPAAVIIIMMFTVPIQEGQTVALIYVLVTNLLLTAVIYTMIGLMGAAIPSLIRCFIPENFMVYAATSLVASFIQIPLMCLYGVLTAMTVDYNEWKYGKKLVAMSGGAIGFGSKVGSGLGSVILSAFLAIGGYQASLESATASMRYSIYGFSNYLPLVVNLAMFLIFTRFDLEEKLPKMREEVLARKEKK